MKHVLSLIFLLQFAGWSALSEPVTSPVMISGKVLSSLEQQPLPGVNVMIKGTRQGVITNTQGVFNIHAQLTDTLVFSFVGYEPLEEPIRGRTSLNVTLIEGIEVLQEVAVFSTGYEQLPQERATGSFAKVGTELLNREVSTDVISRLKGILPSLLVDERNQDGDPVLQIRGRSTIFADATPLIVVDNFPYEGSISQINPQDIESITLLKDAAAASIWGVRAGNGVIVITTKQGQSGQPLQVNFTGNVTLMQQPDLYYQSRMSTEDFIGVERFLFEQGYFDADLANTTTHPPVSPVVTLLDQQRNGLLNSSQVNEQLSQWSDYDLRRDMEKYLYRKGSRQQYALNLQGGGAKNTYYVSAGWDKNLEQLVGNDYQRVSLNARQTFTPFRNLNLRTDLNYIQSTRQNNSVVSELGMTASKALYPYARLVDSQGNPAPVVRDYSPDFVDQATSLGLLDWQYIPLQELDASGNQSRLDDTRLGAEATYTIWKGLQASVKYQFQQQRSESETLRGASSYYSRNLVNQYAQNVETGMPDFPIPQGGILYQGDAATQAHNGRAQLNFQQEWLSGKIAQEISLLAGFEIRQIESEGHNSRLYGFDEEIGQASPVNYNQAYRLYPSGRYATIPGITSISGTLDRFRSYFANGAYTLARRYTLSVSGRIDQSNLFGVRANQRSVPLWSTGVRWALDQEPFYRIDWLPLLNLRATYGYSGNIDRTVTALTTGYFGSDFYHGLTTIGISTPPNPDLSWERSATFNIGVDFEIKKGILSGSLEYFRKQGKDIMGYQSLDPTTGFLSYKGNVASTRGQGWDLVLNSTNIDREFSWQTSFQFSYALDQVTDYPAEPTSLNGYFIDASLTGNSYYITPQEGRPLFGIYSYRWAGLDPDTGDPRGYLDGEISRDYAAMSSLSHTTADSLVYHGPALAPYFGALRNTFTYKGWSLSCNITYRLGYYFRRNSINYSDLYSRYLTHADFEQRWQQPGDEQQTQVPSMIYPANSARDLFYARSSVLVEKADHIRLQDIRISYTLDRSRHASLPFRQVELYGYAANLGMLWRATNQDLDPDFPNQKPVTTLSIGLRVNM